MKNVFKYPDTNSSRAKIEMLNEKFAGLKIGIIGLGGTGAYILDLVSKTPVEEIHVFDGDLFQLHNAFRAPGATPEVKFNTDDDLYKVDYYYQIYNEMHTGIISHREYITAENINVLKEFDFLFISVDKNAVRHFITSALIGLNVPFIDVGLGVNTVDDSLIGTIRVTKGTSQKNDHLVYRIGEDDGGENEYAANIQIADLNCLNASLAVVAWKKHVSFYQDLKKEHNTLYFINTGKILNEDYES
jgi:hypothetical protein